MTLFFILLFMAGMGIGAVAWILIKDKKGTKESFEKREPEQLTSAGLLDRAGVETPESTLAVATEPKEERSLLSRLTHGKKKPAEGPMKMPEDIPLPNLKEYLEKEKKEKKLSAKGETGEDDVIPLIKISDTGTASITTAPTETAPANDELSVEEEKKIEEEINAATELSEIKEKYEKLDALFKEKNVDLEKTEESLDNEIKNRKEFNKVKDILEKELKDTRDKAREARVQLSSAAAEGESYKKRINQLEEKVTNLEKDIIEKDQEIDQLIKRIQTFASPTTSATPPAHPPSQPQEGPGESTAQLSETKDSQDTEILQEPPSQPSADTEAPSDANTADSVEIQEGDSGDASIPAPSTGTPPPSTEPQEKIEELPKVTEPAFEQKISDEIKEEIKSEEIPSDTPVPSEEIPPTSSENNQNEQEQAPPASYGQSAEEPEFLKLRPDILSQEQEQKEESGSSPQNLISPDMQTDQTPGVPKEETKNPDPENLSDNQENNNYKE